MDRLIKRCYDAKQRWLRKNKEAAPQRSCWVERKKVGWTKITFLPLFGGFRTEVT